jgi:hypothetical protein
MNKRVYVYGSHGECPKIVEISGQKYVIASWRDKQQPIAEFINLINDDDAQNMIFLVSLII